MIVNSKTILYGTGAIILLYVLAKNEAFKAVAAVENTAKSAYKPVYNASYNMGASAFHAKQQVVSSLTKFGGWLFNTKQHTVKSASKLGESVYNATHSTVNTTRP